MEIKFFCPRWGSEQIDWDVFCERVQQAGYNGVEYGIPNETTAAELDMVWEKLAKYQLDVIPQHYGTYDADFDRHYDSYSAWLEKLSPYPALKIDSQTGKDFFSFEQNSELINVAARHQALTHVPVCHETHRNKFPFAAHVTFNYLKRIPALRITLDASHWVNVAESYLVDQPEAMMLAIERTDHIHARVGYPEGPQVPDPQAPEWKEALDHHLQWWDAVIDLKRKQQQDIMTITPEFGPYPYMVHLPYTGKPISDQKAVNRFMMEMLRARYE
ncbi:MAG TPA: hypothetical protein VM187_06355 [Niastella sp.]|nr:hypothetical protein [Niastella sp.]